jgi:hypothetical protein
MEAQERVGFEDDRDTAQSTPAHEERAYARDHSISEAEVGGTSPGAIEDRELVLDEYGLSHNGTRAAGPTSRIRVAMRCRNGRPSR